MRRFCFGLVLLLILPCAARAADAGPSWIENYLRSFHENPRREMDRLPFLVDEKGNVRSRGFISWEKVKEAMPFRNEIRESLMAGDSRTMIGIPGPEDNSKDKPERLVDGGHLLRNLQDMEVRALTRHVMEVPPWADSYWPMYKGLIGIRYGDRQFPNSGDWSENYAYILNHPASGIIAFGDPSAIELLSPAEKYDYALGDRFFSLTLFAWRKGQRQFEKTQMVPKWMGICHGWAGAASMNAPVPENPVTVISATGRPVTFQPQDIKALQSMLWANASPATRFVGNRCYVSHPGKNAYGRIMDESCFDANPGTWHMAIVNQMGVNGRSFVMDSTFDAEVWNYPLSAYRYRYFNPETWKESSTMRGAMVSAGNFRVDKFREFRSPETRYVVGVFMDVTHTNAVVPHRGSFDPEPPSKTLRFIYDLELDASFNIIGGEWYSNAHPDFLWTFSKESQAMTPSDRSLLVEPWDLSQPVPSHWVSAAEVASRRGAPLFAFLRKLAESGIRPPEEEGNGEGEGGEAP